MNEVQRFVFTALSRTPVQRWHELELEVRKGILFHKIQRHNGKKSNKTRFCTGVDPDLFRRMEAVFSSCVSCRSVTTYDVFSGGLRVSIDASNGQILHCIEKKRLGTKDVGYLRYSAALEVPCRPPKNIMSMFSCIHPWQSMKEGTPVRLTMEAILNRGLCKPDDPLLGKKSDPSMLWILKGFMFNDDNRPTSTVVLECLPGRIGEHCYPQGAYTVRVFPKSTSAIVPFSRQKSQVCSRIRKKERRAYQLGYGIEMHFTEVKQHETSLVELELQPTQYEIEYDMNPQKSIVHYFFPNDIATLHFIVDTYIPQFVSHVTSKVPHCHIHVFEDTDFGCSVLPLLMDSTHTVCVHNPNFLIGNIGAFLEPLHPRKSRIISNTTELMTRDMIIRGGGEFSEKVDGKLTDLRTMNKARIKKNGKKRKRHHGFYNIEDVEFVQQQVSIYKLKNHFEYIPPFGFQIAEILSRDVEHLFQTVKSFPTYTGTT